MSGTTGVALAYERVAMLNIGTKNASGGYDATGTNAANFVLMGEGFESLEESLNPTVDEVQYISDENATKSITGYAPEWSFDGTVIKDNNVVTFLRNIAKGLVTGATAEAEVVLYDVWSVTAGTVAATKYTVAIQMDSGGSLAGGEKLKFSGSLLNQGDPVDGTFTIATSAFAASV